MSIKKNYSFLLFRHYGQGFLFLAFLVQLFFLVRLGFNYFNELFFVGFKGEDKVNQVSIASIIMTITVLIFILFVFWYMVTLEPRYLKKGLRLVIYLHVCIGLLGVIDLLAAQSSSLVYAKNTLIAAFTF
ncbi:hypothetical protein A5865_001296, partial [Enterococcus sp. 12E11_DIV0728]